MRIDCHTHTTHSDDCWTPVSEVIDTAIKRNLEAVAITDHDTMSGIEKARAEAKNQDIDVIPGVERTVPMGRHGCHLLCLGIERLPPNDDAHAVITSVHEQGGAVILAHPFRNGTGLFYHVEQGNVSEEVAKTIQDRIDYIEIVNWKDNKSDMKSTLNIVQESGKPFVAGSDAHTASEVGRVVSRVNSTKLVDDDPSVELRITGPDSVDINTLPDNLAGHMTRSSSSPAREIVLSIGATVLDIIPGQKPKKSAKRLLRICRSVYEDRAFQGGGETQTERVVLSRTQSRERRELILKKA